MSLSITRRRLVARGDLPGSNGGIYNPGAVLAGDTIHLLCRREVDYRFRPELVFPELVELDRRTLEIRRHRTLLKVGFPLKTRIEDFRCLSFRGAHLTVHTAVGGGIKPVISRVFADVIQREDDFHLPVALTPVEKNWVLFEHDGALHCLYKLDPLTIFVRQADRSWVLVKEEDNGWADEHPSVLSNSANLVAIDDGYLGFWHRIIDGRYVQGAVWLGPDLSIRGRTGVLLDGREVVDGFKPHVIYVSALILDDDRLLAFYGEADAHVGVAIFDRKELMQELRREPFQPVSPLRLRFAGSSLADVFRGVEVLRRLSADGDRRRIRLRVDAPAVREMMARLAPKHVFIDAPDSRTPPRGTLDGPAGAIRWDASPQSLSRISQS
jgi:predicted GH43/DUF377 family glycosyl hydrolase